MKGLNSWSQTIIEANIGLAEIVQREQFVKEEIDRLMASPGSQEKKRIRKLHEEACKLKQKYWRLDRMAYILEGRCPMTILMDGYQALHRQYGWHLISDWLRNDCIRRGGCCGRSCKCCSRPTTQNRLKGWGHCTIECGCCNRCRGFELGKEDKKLIRPNFDINNWKRSPYSCNVFGAYLWGLN